MNTIETIGSYIPKYQITADEIGQAWDGFRARGIEKKRVMGADEDAVTMAVAALKDAIAESDTAREEFSTLAVGTTTPPIDEGDIGVTIGEILGLDDAVEIIVHSQSARAGTRALLSALRADEPALAVASDCPCGNPDDALDHAAGAGAVAAVTGNGGIEISEVKTYSQEYPGTRFRQRGSEAVETYDATAYERDAYMTAIDGAISSLTEVPSAIAPTAPDGSLPRRAGRIVDGGTVYHLANILGDTGAASPLFSLLAAWEGDEESVVILGYGAGASVDALVFEGSLSVNWQRPSVNISYAEYLRKRNHILTAGGEH